MATISQTQAHKITCQLAHCQASFGNRVQWMPSSHTRFPNGNPLKPPHFGFFRFLRHYITQGFLLVSLLARRHSIWPVHRT